MKNKFIEMAAVHRLLKREGLNEGIDNHVSLGLGDGTFLLTPDNICWEMVSASDIVRVGQDGTVVEGRMAVDEITFEIHRAVQAVKGYQVCVIHSHMPYTLAIACTMDAVLEPISQNALRFHGRIAYEDEYGGLGFAEEAQRIASKLKHADILISRNHGVFVSGRSIAEAYELTYYLERAAQVQVLACSLNRKLQRIPDNIAAATAADFAGPASRADALFTASMRLLDREAPDYKL
ncbi:class II aldolase/adducin family protein [Chelatococcus sp. GCM10030263]|uniref:class II aldolase/adducin family protein n=1 Tax=Chelatococcus sp. GCM10030263 TaxID=3273387 RepID=UPI0036173005